MYSIVLFCLPVCVPASFFIHFLTCLVSWMHLYGLPIPSTFFFLLLWFKETENTDGIFIRKNYKALFLGWFVTAEIPVSYFLGPAGRCGYQNSKNVVLYSMMFFSTSDMGMVLCMLSSRLTSVRFFWKVFEPYNDEVRQTQLLSILIHEKLYLFIHSCWLGTSNCP